MKNINILQFREIKPVQEGEKMTAAWKSCNVVEILIDGKDILDIIHEIEVPYMKEEGMELEDAYGHLPPPKLYSYLSEAMTPESFSYTYGAYICCCGDCGETGCWSVTIRVKEEDGYIIWYDFEHEHRDWKYDLQFRFEKEQYLAAMNDLRAMSEKGK